MLSGCVIRWCGVTGDLKVYMENGCLARVNLIGTKGRPGTVPGVPLKGLKKQRTCLKFWFLLGKTPTVSFEMFQEAFKEQAVSRARVFEWFSRFRNGNLSIEDQPRPGRPSSSRNDENIAIIREKLNEDRRYNIDELSGVTGVSWSAL
jgi:hypothetical protein